MMKWDPKSSPGKLARTLARRDKEAIRSLCDDFIESADRMDPTECQDQGTNILKQLKKKRHFDLMRKVAKPLLARTSATPTIGKLYAQALIDDDSIHDALIVLKSLLKNTSPEDPEHAEARGLQGRAYKQLFVDAATGKQKPDAAHLRSALKAYYSVYEGDASKVWHGINAVALLCRAERDSLKVGGYSKPSKVAKAILRTIRGSDTDGTADMWAFATAAEACVALERYGEAQAWLHHYVQQAQTDAFEIAGTLRQLIEVWQLDLMTQPGLNLANILLPALRDRECASREEPAQAEDRKALEKVLGKEGLESYNWYVTGIERSHCVMKVVDEFGEGTGTGFLLKGKDLHESLGEEWLFLTNTHVISDDPEEQEGLPPALSPNDAGIVTDIPGRPEEGFQVKEILWWSPRDELDACLIRLNPQPADSRVAYPFSNNLPKLEKDDKEGGVIHRVYIIGHPRGRRMAFSMYDNHLTDYDSRYLRYFTPTEPGNSGSPVFNRQWKLIGLHHAGHQEMKRLHGKPGTEKANEGIWIQAVIEAIAAAFA